MFLNPDAVVEPANLELEHPEVLLAVGAGPRG
jgi:hypothetical protein